MLEKISAIIAEKLDIDTGDVTMDTTFEELKIDSLDMVEIIMDLEEAFDITIDNNAEMKTVGELIAHIESLA
ncbi:MAG: acyl carrier protein [Christensenellales bacterium]